MEFEEIDQGRQGIIRSPLREIGKDIKWYIPAQVIPALAGFLGLAAYTRLLNPEQYGFYVLTIATVSLVTATGFNWLNLANLRYFEEYRNKAKLPEFISTGMISLAIVFIVISVAWYTATLVFRPHMHKDFIQLLMIGILVLGAQVGFAFMISIVRASRQTKKYGLYSSINALSGVLVAIGLLYFLKLGPEGILWSTVCITSILFCLEIIYLCRNWGMKPSLFSWNLLKKFSSYGIPLIGVSLSSLILSLGDRYMIQYFVGPDEVGVYAAGYGLTHRAIVLLYSILLTASYPVIIQTFEQKEEKETQILLGKILGIFFIIILPAVLGIAVLSKEIVSAVVGSSFQKASIFLPWVAGGLFFLGLSQIITKPFELKKRTIFILYFTVGAACLNILLNLLLIPKFKALGAAQATMASYFVYFVAASIVSIKFFSWSFPMRSFMKSVLATAGMSFVLIIWDSTFLNATNLALKIFLGGVIYCMLLIGLREENILKALRRGIK